MIANNITEAIAKAIKKSDEYTLKEGITNARLIITED